MSRLPLRTRVMAWFSLVSLVIAGALAPATWHLSAVLIVDDGETISSGNLVDLTRLPPAFLNLVAGGTAAHQRTKFDYIPVLTVGLPLHNQTAT